ncbi:hypothetical protein G7Y89_g15504 [Cudoniella acicularis]|uniref:Uncharacterized protein n=1 Tax=Cudoniella acicularis TaxID=354080 RepID=A0A8H4QLQ2_9HELO|nr:hypothetical protein G7Y89_g15504 [Cudoniella acicularis]
MAAAFLSTKPDISRLPSTTGYSLFIALTLHFKSLIAQRKLSGSHMGRLRAALLILERLQTYWVTIQGLWSNLETLFSNAGFDIDAICGNEIIPHTSVDDQPPDIEPDRVSPHTRRKSVASVPQSIAIDSQEASQITPNNGLEAQSNLVNRNRALSEAPVSNPRFHHVIPRQNAQFHGQPPSIQLQQTWPNFNTSNGDSQTGFERVPGGVPSGFIPLDTVSENVGMRNQPSNMGFDASGIRSDSMHNYDVYGNMGGMVGMEMDIDSMNFWWDQSYVASDANVEQIGPNVDEYGSYSFH